MPAPIIKDMALKLDDEVLANIVKEYNGRKTAVPRTRPKRFTLERDCYVDHKKEAVEDFFSWMQEKYGESTIVHIRKTNGKIPYGLQYQRPHAQ